MNELTKKILEFLEIEPDEKFKTFYASTNSTYIQIFNSKENKFKYRQENSNTWMSDASFLNDVCSGECIIIDTLWKPKYNEIYYFIEENGNINEYRNDNSYLDLMLWHIGNCFKTKAEAEANKDKIMKLYESDIPLWQKVEDKE